MTQPTEYFLVRELRPVTFKEVRNDGTLAVYRALVGDLAKSKTVFSLTATTASPADTAEQTALLESLNEIEAAFYVLSNPGPSNTVPTEPQPFDPVTEVMIELGLADSASKGPVSFAAAVQATAAGTKVTVRHGKTHIWSTGGGAAWATLNVSGGKGTVQPKGQLLTPVADGFRNNINAINKYRTNSNEVTLRSDTQMTYILYGNPFTLP